MASARTAVTMAWPSPSIATERERSGDACGIRISIPVGRHRPRCTRATAERPPESGPCDGSADSRPAKVTIYDQLVKERITAEVFPDLDFALDGNFYPKLVRLVARKIGGLLEKPGGEARVPELLDQLGLKLTPHIAAEVWKVLTTSRQRYGFFDWAGRQPDFQHNAHTYNLKLRNLVTEDGGRPGMLTSALIHLEEMVARDFMPERLSCNVLIDWLCKDGKVAAARKLAKALERRDFPDVFTYNSLIHALGRAGLFAEVFEVLEEMKRRECAPDVVTFNTLIGGLSKAGMVNEAFAQLEEMAKRGCAPDRFTYNSMIYGLGNVGQWPEAVRIFDAMQEKRIVPDVITYNVLMVVLFRCGQLPEAVKVYEQMRMRDCQPDQVTYNTLIDGLAKCGQLDEAWNIFHCMREKGFDPDPFTYSSMIRGLAKNHRVAEAAGLVTEMKEKDCDSVTEGLLRWFKVAYGRDVESLARNGEVRQSQRSRAESDCSLGGLNEQRMHVLQL